MEVLTGWKIGCTWSSLGQKKRVPDEKQTSIEKQIYINKNNSSLSLIILFFSCCFVRANVPQMFGQTLFNINLLLVDNFKKKKKHVCKEGPLYIR